ncbi:replicative DNA helicase [Paraburkholderia sp. JHI2823]|uniref:replicative DNA helicase n=1 Tax=Paraburkholderia sp. JHI2823 TaxID=3112960 RepID=UPI00317344DE
MSNVPPHAIEAEQSVIGGLLLQNDAIDRVGDLLSEHFYRNEHRIIFGEIQRIIAANRTADVVTVMEALTLAGKLESVGGLMYLNALAQNTPSAANVKRYAEIVTDRWQMRELLKAADEIRAMVENRNGREASEVMGAAQALLEPMSEARGSEGRECGALLAQVIGDIDDQHSGTAEVQVTPTGLRDLDDKLCGGLRGSQLVVVAARPSIGKTALTLQFGGHVSDSGGVVAVFSMETPAKQLCQRNLARVGRIPLSHVKDGKRMTDDDWPKLTHATQRIAEWKMVTYDKPGMTAAEIIARCRALKRKHARLDLVIIDYLQLMTGGPSERDDIRIGSYSTALKGLAMDLDVPVVALAQLNRQIENRPNKAPVMADLRGSGNIEQDADVILFLHREECYDPNTMQKGIAEITIGKQRDGERGAVVRTAFDGATQRFEDLPPGYVPRAREENPRAGARPRFVD